MVNQRARQLTARRTEPEDTIAQVRLRLGRARALAQAWVSTLPEEDRAGQSLVFVRGLLKGLSARRSASPAGRATSDPAEMDSVAVALRDSILDDATRLPLLESLYVVTGFHPALMNSERRGELGAFYTPPSLVGRLLDQAEEAGLDWATARVLDPAAGASAFLVAAALRMRQALPDCAPAFFLAQLATRLKGIEIDPAAAEIAQLALEVALVEVTTTAGRPMPQIVTVANTLDEEPQAIFDLVVGNPPYGRTSLSAEQRRRYQRSLYGHANLYGVFTDLALRWTKPQGLIAYLTPTSFLAGQYYSALRQLLATEAPPIAFDFVHDRSGVFDDVLQETMLAVYRRAGDLDRTQIHYIRVSGEGETSIARNGTIGLPSPPTLPWLAPRDQRHCALIAHAETLPTRLSDWGYSVSTGPLVWNRFKKQLASSEGPTTRPIIWAESVTADGRFIHRSNKRNHAPHIRLRKKDAWLLVEDPCVLIQRTTAKEQDRRLIAAELPKRIIKKHKGVVVENHLNMVRPSKAAVVAPAIVAALFNSRAVDDVFRCMSGSVAVSAFELEALPLPAPSSLKKLSGLIGRKADKAAIDRECDRLYGIERA